MSKLSEENKKALATNFDKMTQGLGDALRKAVNKDKPADGAKEAVKVEIDPDCGCPK